MLRHLIGAMLDDTLPAKTKRQVFLVSFFALLKGSTTNFDQETLQKLNRVLALSESTDKALAVPVILAKVIWNGKSLQDICQQDLSANCCYNAEGITSIVGDLLQSAPKWTLYGKAEDMEKDIATIFDNRLSLGV